MPRVTTHECNGGNYVTTGKMSREFYKTNHNHFGTIGQMIKQVAQVPNIKISDQRRDSKLESRSS